MQDSSSLGSPFFPHLVKLSLERLFRIIMMMVTMMMMMMIMATPVVIRPSLHTQEKIICTEW